MEFNKQELAQFLGTTVCRVETDFPKLKAKSLSNGYLITKRGKGNSAVYEVDKVEPKQVDSAEFSSRKITKWTADLPGEKWITTYCNNNFEVSSEGRIRNKQTLVLPRGTINKDGYQVISIQNKNYLTHRIVLASFDPVDNFDSLTVDHINGIKTDNRLLNLRWATAEDNAIFMAKNRAEIQKEITRLLSKYSYTEIVDKLKAID